MKQPHPILRVVSLVLAVVMFGNIPVQARVISRGGSAPGPSTPTGSSADLPVGLPNPQERLQRTAQALQAVKQMQAQARAVAVAGPNNLGPDPNHPGATLPDVPNGLVVGGLQVDPAVAGNPALWTGANAPVPSVAGGQTIVTVEQTAPQAILNWETFNIGKQTTLKFDQSAGGANVRTWIAFNKINDPTGVPSQILGLIQALGQVYVINPNGIIFGGSSQVALSTLVASALPINDNLIARGLLNNPDTQFLFTALPLTAGANGMPAFTPPAPATPDGLPGDVTVQAGAQITTPTTADHVGGRVALIGANVKNAGAISTPDGQTILAAGLQVGLEAHSTSDPSLRGLDAYVGQVAPAGWPSDTPRPAGTAVNEGLIDVPRGNTTMVGAEVNQLGFIDSTTSVSLNGRVDLLADYDAVGSGGFEGLASFFPRQTGVVRFGEDSVTRILPELDSPDKVVGTKLALTSQIKCEGLTLYMGPNAAVLAPNANVTLDAGVWSWTGIGSAFAVGSFSQPSGVGQVYLDAGATIDVGGTMGAQAHVADNIVAVQLNAAELADSPLLRDGLLRGETIHVDMRDTGTFDGRSWVGTPVANASGYINLAERTVGELTTAGGAVAIRAGEAVVMQPGAKMDVSGGWIDYQGGETPVTKLVAGGKVFSVAQATPDRLYDRIIQTTQFEDGYVQGKDGGMINISAPAMALDGELVGKTYAGLRQQQVRPGLSQLTLSFPVQYTTAAPVVPLSAPPAVIFQSNSELPLAEPFVLDALGHAAPLRAERKALVVLSPGIVGGNGFGSFSLNNSDGLVEIPAGTVLQGVVGGSVSIAAANLDIAGDIVVPGGSLQLTAYNFSPSRDTTFLFAAPTADATRGNFTLGANSRLDVSGTVALDYTADQAPVRVDGGTVSIKSYSADLQVGSLIDASGGVSTSGAGKRTYGKGGTISISVGQDPVIAAILGGQLLLGSTLQAYGGTKGGSLNLLAPAIQIGGTTANPDTLLFAPEFFSTGGFSSFSLRGLGAPTAVTDTYLPGMVIAPGIVLAPKSLNRIVVVDEGGLASLAPVLLPDGLRAPVNLAFGATGVVDLLAGSLLVVRGDLVLSEGAVVRTDATGTVSLNGTTVAVLGSVLAPGGTITVAGGNSFATLFPPLYVLPTVHLGPASELNAAGTTLLTPNALGYRTGSVLPGGTIRVSGNIVAEAGAVLDVAGASGVLDFAPGYLGLPSERPMPGAPLTARTVDSNGGAITLAGGQMLMSAATLRGFAGGPTASGGNLSISSGRYLPPGVPGSLIAALDVTLAVSQQGLSLSPAFYPAGGTAIGQRVLDDAGQPLAGLGYFAAADFQDSGFASLTLRGTVRFDGPVSLTAARSITLADAGLIYADAAVALNASYISVGTPFQPPKAVSQQQSPYVPSGLPIYFTPTYGPGSLTLLASTLLDCGWLSLQNIGTATFAAPGGDIRGVGTAEMAGHWTLRAGQISPTTANSFTLAAYDYNPGGGLQRGSITIEAAGPRQLPLSAAGTLSLYASVIHQNGPLRAPLGAIRLGWDGTGTAPRDIVTGTAFPAARELTLGPDSVTAVSAIDPLTGAAWTLPYGINQNGIAWIDPIGTDITRNGPPAKAITLASANISVDPAAEIDLRGGGDLYAYRWVRGNGGSQDILASASSFAILPGYTANYAPFAPYNPNPLETTVFGGDAGYVNSSLAVGDRVYLADSPGLPAGNYTLLPGRYALLPGAFLLTPQTGIPVGNTVAIPGGSSLVTGYRFNSLNAPVDVPLYARFQVSPATVVRARAEYENYGANQTIAAAAAAAGVARPRLPRDAGQLVFSATQSLALDGLVRATAGTGGLGGLVDISSPQDILIAGPGVAGPAGVLVLPSLALSAFGAESLLIGGVRRTDASGTRITVQTGNLTVDNAGAPLTGVDIALVARNQLTLAPGADIESVGAMSSPSATFLIGDATVAGSGNGVLLRVSADPTAAINRFGVNTATSPALTIGAGAVVTGPGVIVDSTRVTTLNSTAILRGSAVTLASGRISLELTDPGALPLDAGLVLSGTALENLQVDVQTLSLTSYSTVDTYGVGQIGRDTLANLALHTAEIRGFNQGADTVTFVADNILLDNQVNGTAPGALNAPSGTLTFAAGIITLGVNQLALDQFAQLELRATGGIFLQGTGTLTTPASLTMQTPLITGATAANQTLRAGGAVILDAGVTSTTLTPGLGGQLTLVGANITDNTRIALPSGILRLQATGGDLLIGSTAEIDLTGITKTFFDQVRQTDGGQLTLRADLGSLVLDAGSLVNVSAPAGGGNAGQVTLAAPNGNITLAGALLAHKGTGGSDGSFLLDVGTLTTPSLAAWNTLLDDGGFTQSRSFRVRSGNVLLDGLATAHEFALSADNGTITVAGTVDARRAVGGKITLAASGSLIVQNGASLTVAGADFDNAGKGGSVYLAAGQAINGVIDATARLTIQNGATIDLSVAQGAELGQVTGTLHLRAPQTAGNLDAQIDPIDGTILNASRIMVEGYERFTATTIDNTVHNDVFNNGGTFAGNTVAIRDRLLANNAGLASVLRIRPGAEIVNAAGDLTLNTTWDLSTYRFGTDNQPGILTLRAAGNLNFDYNSSLQRFASLTDGFLSGLFYARLLPAGNESWSYRLVAGADFSAANALAVQSFVALGGNAGSLLLGRYAQLKGAFPYTSSPAQNILPGYFQTIRTGTGDIEISAGRDIQLLSPLATIYTAGMQTEPLASFDLPNLVYQQTTVLGPVQNSSTTRYLAQYTCLGGNVSLAAQNDIVRYEVLPSGVLSPDSSREMPSNWLYRRGYVNPATGEYGITRNNGEIASTTWWVDFSNFFQGVGALGGGNVSLVAGRDVANMDAVVPTNVRMPKGSPEADALVELGGGDLLVQSGRNIDGGVYYVERGDGILNAGNEVRSNPTRAALNQTTVDTLKIRNTTPDPSTWLPTTLFLGKGSFEIAARGDLLLGPVANPFLLPQGINNSYYNKSYFLTYAPASAVAASSLTGDLTFRASAHPTSDGSAGSLASWYRNVLLYSPAPYNDTFASKSQPWLRLAEGIDALTAFTTVYSLLPANLRLTACAGDLNLIGQVILAPSPTGALELLADGAINGLQPNGLNSINRNAQWGTARLNLSDADPNRLPSLVAPLSLTYLGPTATSTQERSAWSNPDLSVINAVFASLNAMFGESGSARGTYGVLQTKLALHAPGPLHDGDASPALLYASHGDIAGLTLFASKATRVFAGQDIADIALYVQNVAAADISIVSAGRDIIAYNPGTSLRGLAQTAGNELLLTEFGRPTAGDIQINGPGTLMVLAGRNLDLGIGPNASDGTAVGITSIGNARNPSLPATGADVIVAAGIGGSSGLAQSAVDFNGFIAEFLDPATASANAARYLPALGKLMALPDGTATATIWNQFQTLPAERRCVLALDIFYLVLRDAGRDHNIPTAAGYRNFDAGFAAIDALFPDAETRVGDINLTSREIKTASGGDISLLAPNGRLLVGYDLSGNQPVDQGVLTESGGNIAIFTHKSAIVGTSRIFTLRGGNIIMWSSTGDIAAGASSKTLQSAPPTRVLIDPQSADVQTDLAGLATGGGIGVLTTVAEVPPGDVDLIAPAGVIDAGEAGIRVSGNINLAAQQVLNVGNIQAQGSSAGVPAVSVSVNVSGIQAANATVASATATTAGPGAARENVVAEEAAASLISVEVLGYGGREGDSQPTDDDEKEKRQP